MNESRDRASGSIRHLEIAHDRDVFLRRLAGREVGGILVDLKRRIVGDSRVLEEDGERIVLGNRACPFHPRPGDDPAPGRHEYLQGT